MSIVLKLARALLGPSAAERIEQERDKTEKGEPKLVDHTSAVHRAKVLEDSIRERAYFICGELCTGAWPDKPEFLQTMYEVETLHQEMTALRHIYESDYE